MRKEIDIKQWNRKEHFEFYSKIATPHYCVAFNIDITNLLAFTRKNKISFYYSLIYLCTQSINQIDEFLLETEDNKVYRIDRRVPCFTDLKKDSTSFHNKFRYVELLNVKINCFRRCKQQWLDYEQQQRVACFFTETVL